MRVWKRDPDTAEYGLHEDGAVIAHVWSERDGWHWSIEWDGRWSWGDGTGVTTTMASARASAEEALSQRVPIVEEG